MAGMYIQSCCPPWPAYMAWILPGNKCPLSAWLRQCQQCHNKETVHACMLGQAAVCMYLQQTWGGYICLLLFPVFCFFIYVIIYILYITYTYNYYYNIYIYVYTHMLIIYFMLSFLIRSLERRPTTLEPIGKLHPPQPTSYWPWLPIVTTWSPRQLGGCLALLEPQPIWSRHILFKHQGWKLQDSQHSPSSNPGPPTVMLKIYTSWMMMYIISQLMRDIDRNDQIFNCSAITLSRAI